MSGPAPASPGILVIGAGNDLRHDDAAGLEAARRVRRIGGRAIEVIEACGDLSGLAGIWSGRDRVILLDAARSGAPCGTVHRLDAAAGPLPVAFARGSTHGLGIAEAVELSRALGRLPRALVIYGIEGREFGPGTGLSPAVAEAVESLAGRLAREWAHA